jgi:hypothetical protein
VWVHPLIKEALALALHAVLEKGICKLHTLLSVVGVTIPPAHAGACVALIYVGSIDGS